MYNFVHSNIPLFVHSYSIINSEMMDNVISKAEKLKYSNLLNDLYEINEKHKIFEKQMIRDEAREEGLAEGLKEGRDKGIKEGIQEGMKE